MKEGMEQMTQIKCVRFHEPDETENGMIHSARNEDDLHETWLSPEDFQAIRFEYKGVAAESRKSGMVSLIEQTINQIEENPLEAIESLTLWAMHAHSRRGLESQISSSLRQYRKNSQQQVRKSVMSLQDTLRLMNWSLEEKTNMIADVYIRETKVSKELAVAMGKADMKAVFAKSHSGLKMNTISTRKQVTDHECSPISTLEFELY
jgi:hypothetical protein